MEKQMVDKGFELIYWNLSYRRKFIRTLWMIPILILAMALMIIWDSNIFLIIGITITGLITLCAQLIYLNKKSKQ